jgi:hypothetical protein
MTDSKELVARLRARCEYQSRGYGEVVDVPDGDCDEAADAIEALEAENARLREALEPIVKDAQRNLFFMGSNQQMHPDGLRLCEFDLDRARKALEGVK